MKNATVQNNLEWDEPHQHYLGRQEVHGFGPCWQTSKTKAADKLTVNTS
jgi:hypothetical protein